MVSSYTQLVVRRYGEAPGRRRQGVHGLRVDGAARMSSVRIARHIARRHARPGIHPVAVEGSRPRDRQPARGDRGGGRDGHYDALPRSRPRPAAHQLFQP